MTKSPLTEDDLAFFRTVAERELVLLRDTVAASAVLSWDEEDDIMLMLLAAGAA